MANPFFNRDIISMKEFSASDLDCLFRTASRIRSMEYEQRRGLASGKVLGLMFFEPSTRTRLSFESAMLSVGGNFIGFAEPGTASIGKGENMADTVRIMENYADILVLRHPMEGAARFAAEVASRPLINAGSGAEEHPTQAMLDLYTILLEKGRIEGLNIALVGDLKYGRAVYSLLYGLSNYGPRVFFVSPPQLRVRREGLIGLEDKIKISEHEGLGEIMGELDVIYVTRIQKERFPDPHEYERVKGSYTIDKELLRDGKEGLIVLHPLPRVDEIKPEVDGTSHAKYFIQAQQGKIVRAALISLILNEDADRLMA